MAADPGYWEYDPQGPLSSRSCGWHGTGAGHEEYFRELLEVRCPGCRSMLLVIVFPTDAETRAAAAAGSAAAAAELPVLDWRLNLQARADKLQLERKERGAA